MNKAQAKYLHKETPPPPPNFEEKPLDADVEPERLAQAKPAEASAREPSFSNPGLANGNTGALGGSLLQIYRCLESTAVNADRLEHLVVRKSPGENLNDGNRAQVQPYPEGQTIESQLQWFAHKANSLNDRITQAIARLDSLTAV
jgi:hypothetical protein